MDYNTFAEQIKQKYPQYQNVDNKTLAQKMVAKYPIYASKVQFGSGSTPSLDPSGTTGKIADFIGGSKLAQGLGQTLANNQGAQSGLIQANDQAMQIQGNLINKIKQDKAAGIDTTRLENALNEITSHINTNAAQVTDLGTGGLTNREVVGSALQLGALAIPGVGENASIGANLLGETGGRIAAKSLAGAATGYAFDVANNLQNKDKSVGQSFIPGIGTAVGAALPVVSALIGKATKDSSQKIAQNLEQSNLRLSPKDKAYIEKSKQDFIPWLAEQKITGTPEQRYTKISDLYDSMEQNIQSVIKSKNDFIPKTDFINAIRDIPDQFIDDPQLYNAAQNQVDNLISVAQEKYPKEIPLDFVNSVKRNFGKRAFDKSAQQVVNESSYEISQNLYDLIKNKVPELEGLNDEYSKIILAKKLMYKALGRQQLGIVGKIAASAVGGAVGSAVGGPIGTGVGIVAGKNLATTVAGTKARSIIGSGMQKIYEKASSAKPGTTFKVSRNLILSLVEAARKQSK